MTTSPLTRPAWLLTGFPRAAGIGVAALGGLVLAGWALDLPALRRLVPGLAEIPANLALFFALTGAALALLADAPGTRRRFAGHALAALGALLAAVTLIEHLAPSGRDLDLLLTDPLGHGAGAPAGGRMSQASAWVALMAAGALLLLHTRRVHWPAELLAVVPVFLCLMGLTWEVARLVGLESGGADPRSPLPAVAFLVLGAGTLCARPDRAGMAIVASDRLGGVLARRLLPVAVLAPLVLWWVLMLGVRSGRIGPAVGGVSYFLSSMVVFSGMVLWAAVVLNRLDAARSQVEDELRRSEARFRALIENSYDAVTLTGPDGVIRYASPASGRVLGRPADGLVGTDFSALIHPDDREPVREKFAGGLAAPGAVVVGEFRVRHRDGSWHWVEATATNLLADPGVGAVVSNIRDVTDRRRAEEELREADRRKDDFLAMLAHELRNPLAPVRNALQILKMPGLGADTARQAREMMERQVQHIVRLVDDLLDVSRIMRGKIELRKERVDLATAFARAVETAQPAIDAQGQDLTVTLPPRSIYLEADLVRLAQVIANLLVNAAKYTDKAGRIWLTGERDGGRAVIRVRDSGIGIPPDLLPRVFDLFTQAERTLARSQGGLGVGLTLVKKLVELHGGGVEAHSAGPGRGSEFVVRLPALPEVPAGDGQPPEDSGRVSGPPRRVLVVDDNVDAAESAAMLLRFLGHEVEVVYDGPSALEAAREFRPEIILLDIGLPGMSGYDVARALRARSENQGVVLAAVTGYGQDDDLRRSREAGFDYHLTKPLAPGALTAFVAAPGTSVPSAPA